MSSLQFVNNLPNSAAILVTGATGLIGSNLVEQLLKSINLSGRRDVQVYSHTRNKSNIVTNGIENLNVIDTNLFNFRECQIKFDAIFHFATFGQPGKFTSDPIATLKLNSMAVFELEACLKPNGIFYFASSSEIYSGNMNIPHVETEAGFTNTTHPRSMYIEAKRFGEAYCFWQSQGGNRYFSGRIALSYGPGTKLDDERVLNQLIVRGIKEGKIQLRDDGAAVRQYCYVSDTIDIIFKQINCNFFGPLNVCGTEIITIRSLGELIASKLGVPFVAGPSYSAVLGAPQVVRSSIEQINLLGKKHFISMDDGIERVIKWYREII